MDTARLCAAIRPDRLRTLTHELVCIPSPTGHAADCTRFLAERLAQTGLAVELDTGRYPEQPSLLARLPGGGGPTVQFDGHTDHVPLPHPAPECLDDRIIGRGAADMKGSLAIMAEVAAVFADCGVVPPGDILFTAHDLHEAPNDYGESLTDLCRRGRHGDVAVVCETGQEVLPLVGRGMGIFELHVARAGELCHEVTGAPNPIDQLTEALSRLRAQQQRMAAVQEPYVGAETIFVGQVEAGAFYNQVPTAAYAQGTWRFSPQKTAAEAEAELRALLADLPLPEGITLDPRFTLVRPSYALSPDEPLVRAFQAAYQSVHDRPLPLAGAKAVCDVPIFVREAGIPCVGHGPANHGAHGEPEYVLVDDLAACCRVYLRMLAEYWGA